MSSVFGWDEVSMEVAEFDNIQADITDDYRDVLSRVDAHIVGDDYFDPSEPVSEPAYLFRGKDAIVVVGYFGDHKLFVTAYGNMAVKYINKFAKLIDEYDVDTAEDVAKLFTRIMRIKPTNVDERKYLSDVSNEFERMVLNNEINFIQGNEHDIPIKGRYVLEWIKGINWLIGDKKIGDNVVLKLSHPVIQFVDIYGNGKCLFSTDNHQVGIHPSNVSSTLARDQKLGSDDEIDSIANQLWDRSNDNRYLPSNDIDDIADRLE